MKDGKLFVGCRHCRYSVVEGGTLLHGRDCTLLGSISTSAAAVFARVPSVLARVLSMYGVTLLVECDG